MDKNEEPPKVRLKPIVYTTNIFNRGSQNTTQQILLLKALQVTQDPKELRRMIGVKTVADVYRTLDKIAMRKEYHQALHEKGVSFQFIVEGLKGIAEGGEKDADRLKAYQTLLKSLGMEKYEASDGASSGTWEEVLLKKVEEQKALPPNEQAIVVPKVYEVQQPVVPDSVKKKREQEEEITSSIYDAK